MSAAPEQVSASELERYGADPAAFAAEAWPPRRAPVVDLEGPRRMRDLLAAIDGPPDPPRWA